MRKVLNVAIIIIIVFSLTGCGGRSQIINTGYSKNVSETIIRCFNDEDIGALVKIFSPYIQENEDLEEQIEDAFDEIEGKITSYKVFSYGYDGSIREGKWIIKNEQVQIYDIVTETGEKYIIDYSEYLIYDDKSEEGIYELFLRDEENNIIQKMGGYK